MDFARDPKNVNLAAMALSRHRTGQFQQIIDPTLVDQGEDATAERDAKLESITKVADLAIACLAFHRVDRPAMKDVLEVLTGIKGVAWKRRKDEQAREANSVVSDTP